MVEYGNRRVSKFSPDGEYLTSFGQRSVEFAGFLSPTGIAVTRDRVFVADNISKKIFTFDKNGMYLGILVGDGLFQPESLKIYPDGNLIVADTNRLLLVDIDSSVVKELCPPENSRVRYTSAQTGANGCIFAANFNAGEVAVLSALDDVASGFFVQIDRTVSMDFPVVTLEVSVQDRNRRPITGLTNSNFVLSEDGHPVDIQQFVAAGITQDEADVTVLVERSQTAGRARGELGAAMRDIEAAMSGRIKAIISAGREPVRESFSMTNPASMQAAVQGAAASFTERWRFDMGLRLAATELLSLSKKRAVIFITTGSVGELAFERYSLSELAAYMANNGITFYAVLVGGNEAGEELKYLCRETGGAAVQLYTPQGIAPVLQKLLNKPTGSYTLRYSTGLRTNFGRAFLPIEAEVYLLERSGRDNVGYFPPLE
ncbi:hypothetical protein AGMMS50212_15700 [Spirochaetia bacterium]|nr:hypothetical protein AGMMS50212_15700 [Spirochaetia bacterium]